MNFPKISIITPSFNQGEFIEDTICSIINQNYPNLEYIICDGGSTDNTVDIIKKYEDKITFWCSEKDKGQTDAINKGMKKATGDIVGWLNSDDVLLPGSLFQIANFFAIHRTCEFMNGTLMEMDRKGDVLKFTHIIMSKYFMKHGCFNICQQGMFWKRELFDKVGFLNKNFHAEMDVEWLIRNYESGTNIKLYNKPLGAIRVHEETKTAQGGVIWENDQNAIAQKYGKSYTPNHKSIFFCFFVLIKIIKGCYFLNIFRTFKYRNKKFSTYRY